MHSGSTSPFIVDFKDADGLIHDLDGNTFANHMSAWGAAPYGPFPPEVRQATIEAWDRYGMEISCFLQSPPVVELAERLVALAPKNITRVAPTVTGTEAVEGSIKLARECTGRPMILAFLGQYHGESTYLAASTSTELPGSPTGNAQYTPGLVFAPYPSSYRAPFTSGAAPHDDTVVIDYIEKWLLRHQVEPTQIAAVLIEPIAGELGVYAPSQAFWDGLNRLRKEHGWLLICDEIQSGMGRSGPVWAGDLWGLEPDMLLTGKGLAAGGQAMAAILGTDQVMADSHVYTTGTYVWEPAAVAGALGRARPARRRHEECTRAGEDRPGDPHAAGCEVRAGGGCPAVRRVGSRRVRPGQGVPGSESGGAARVQPGGAHARGLCDQRPREVGLPDATSAHHAT